MIFISPASNVRFRALSFLLAAAAFSSSTVHNTAGPTVLALAPWSRSVTVVSSRRNVLLKTSAAAAFLAVHRQPACAISEQQSTSGTADCNEECRQERRKKIMERRAILQQSRTTTKRSDMFELSRQRAALYNTTYQGAACPPGGVPCL